MKIGAVGHIKVFRITLKSGAGKSSLDPVAIDGVQSPSACRFITIHTDGYVSTKRLCDFTEDLLYLYERAMIFTGRVMKWQIQSLTCFGAFLIILGAWAGPARGDEGQRSPSFQVQKGDVAKAEKLADQLASLSPRVNRDEAKLLADCAFVTVTKLRREYRMFGTPIFNNFLIYHGLRKRGYCYQWSEDLLLALDKLHLKSLDLRWGEYDPNTWRENNCIVVTAKGQLFNRGIMLECWRHLGHLYFGPVASDWEHYVENSAYARRVRDKAAGSTVSERNHPVAFQRSVVTKGKAGD
jgi:hypothetical protein